MWKQQAQKRGKIPAPRSSFVIEMPMSTYHGLFSAAKRRLHEFTSTLPEEEGTYLSYCILYRGSAASGKMEIDMTEYPRDCEARVDAFMQEFKECLIREARRTYH